MHGELTVTMSGGIVIGPSRVNKVVIDGDYVVFYHDDGSITSMNRFLCNLDIDIKPS